MTVIYIPASCVSGFSAAFVYDLEEALDGTSEFIPNRY
jgi:hypothetical protein